MATRTTLTAPIAQGTTARLTGTIVQEDGVTGFKPSTLTLTLYAEDTGAIVNSRTASNVLDTNGGTVTSGGALVMELSPADNAMVITPFGRGVERHVALFEWTWNSGARAGKYEIAFDVVDLQKVS